MCRFINWFLAWNQFKILQSDWSKIFQSTRNTIFQATVYNYNKVNFHLHKLQQKLIAIHASFYKQHFYKQPQAEISKKLSKS